MKSTNFKSLVPFRNIEKKRARGKPLTIEEKKAILRIFDATLEEKAKLKNKLPPPLPLRRKSFDAVGGRGV